MQASVGDRNIETFTASVSPANLRIHHKAKCSTAASEVSHLNDIEFDLDWDARGPAPLDDAIANVWLKPIGNKFSEGFQVEVSANFGFEPVLLEGDGQALQVEMGIKKATVRLHCKNCQPTPISSDDGLSTYTRLETAEEAIEVETENLVKNNGDLQASTSGQDLTMGGAVGLTRTTARNDKTRALVTRQETRKWDAEWQRSGPTAILVGSGKKLLLGQTVAHLNAWHIEIDTSQPFAGIMASLTTRAQWLEFGKIEFSDLKSTVAHKVKALFRGKKSRDQELFMLLLKTLAARGLCSKNNGDAMLAAHVQIMRRADPGDDLNKRRPLTVPPAQGRRSIGIDMSLVEYFLDTNSTQKLKLLRQQGAPAEEIDRIAGRHEEYLNISGKAFNAGAAPHTALGALEFTRANRVNFKMWDQHNSNRSRADLLALGLIVIERGFVFSTVPFKVSSEDALRYAASCTPTLIATREILSDDPQVGSLEIGREIARQFRLRRVSEASHLKTGIALRRWATWLEDRSPAAPLGNSAKSGQPGLDAPSLATPETLERLQGLLNAGIPHKTAAQEVGISKFSLYLWVERGLVKLPNKKRTKPRKV
jgi:hypothetical protein